MLTAAGAAVAVAVELLEALAIVLAVGTSRRWRDAVLGAAAGAVACLVLAVLLGPVLLANVSLDVLRIAIGALLLLLGIEWLRKGTLRLAGRRARSSSQAEYEETREELEGSPLPPVGQADWAAQRSVKGVADSLWHDGGAVLLTAGAVIVVLVSVASGARRR